MTTASPDKLVLRGRLQVETALGALMCTGANQNAQERLRLFLDLHAEHTCGTAQEDLLIATEGGTTTQDKADIITGLETLVCDNEASDEIRSAAAVLYEQLQQ